ncbi:Transmembrane protein 19 [Termitomyces sp. T112]|nr:Transmembrane protein 19 [Termitomyces sp. T112]
MNNLVLAVSIASLLSVHGLRRRSLSPSGAATAFAVGFLTFAGALRVFGVALIVFYLIGSRATKYGKERKRRLEEGYVEAGYRSGWQVLSNSAWAVIAVTLWNAMHAPQSVQAFALQFMGLHLDGPAFAPREWCAVQSGSREFVFAVLGHFGCCLGDTLASELGILSTKKPRLVTTGQEVPPGTNGGMTTWGTACSACGGAIIGLVMALDLLWENGACGVEIVVQMVIYGSFAGGFGSLVDSLLGATVQKTRYNAERGLILQDGSPTEGRVINGLDLLTNNQVNLLSSLITAGILGWMTL